MSGAIETSGIERGPITQEMGDYPTHAMVQNSVMNWRARKDSNFQPPDS